MLKYCRAGNVCAVVADMRNRNRHPVLIKPGEDNDLKGTWSNEVPILWEFCYRYLSKEGLTSSSKGVDDLFAYVFHGRYSFTRKHTGKDGVSEVKTVLKPVVHALHFKLTAHRSRFTTDVTTHFQELYKLLDDNPEWVKFLDDGGEGSVPRALLIAVEKAIRSYAFTKKNSKMTMGIGPARQVTRRLYAGILPWRKVECYIAGVRFRRSRTIYHKWEDFSWSDYVERNALAQTFIARHLPLSDGEDHFGGELKDPPEWGGYCVPSSTGKTNKSTGKKKSKVTVKPEPQPVPVPMKFDVTKGCLVPYIDLS